MAEPDNPYRGVMFPVKATVIEKSAEACSVRHEAGTAWYLHGVPAGICSFAFQSMFPIYWTLRFGGVDPAETDPDQMHAVCSRAGCGARFRLRRIADEEAAEMQSAASTITIDDLLESIPSGLSRKIK